MGNKWVELANLQRSTEISKNTKAIRDQHETAAADQARIAHLEAQVAALEARVQWAIDAIQHMQRQG